MFTSASNEMMMMQIAAAEIDERVRRAAERRLAREARAARRDPQPRRHRVLAITGLHPSRRQA
jgi:hypothetical protein